MEKKIKTLFLTTTLIFSLCCHSGVAVIVNPNNNNELNTAQIKKIFLGKINTFPDGSKAIPFDLAKGQKPREMFLQKVLKRNESSLNSYWIRMLFSSKGKQPTMMDNDEAIKFIVANNIHAIGYISTTNIDATIKVIQQFDR